MASPRACGHVWTIGHVWSIGHVLGMAALVAYGCVNHYCRKMQVEEAVRAYLRRLREAGRTTNTLRGYQTDLRGLIKFALKTDGELTGEVVAAYVMATMEVSAATRARRLSALRGLLRDRGLLSLIPEVSSTSGSEHKRRPGASRPVVREGIRAVLERIPRHADRDQLLFGLLARLGLRPGEVLALRVEDFDEASESLTVPGWGGTRRRVYVDDREILLRLTNYVRSRATRPGALFTASGRDTPLRYQSIRQRWARYCEAAGVSVQLIDLRRAHAEDLLAGGVPEHIVRDRLGQRTGPVTGRGSLASEEASDEALRAWHERASSAVPGVEVEVRGRAG